MFPIPFPPDGVRHADGLRHHPRLHCEWLIVYGLARRCGTRRNLVQHFSRNFSQPYRGQSRREFLP